MILARIALRRLFAGSTALLFTPGLLLADLQTDSRVTPPPAVRPVQVVVQRGATAVITMRTFGLPQPGTRYLVRKAPEFGVLAERSDSDPRIVYRHLGEGSVDTILYAAQGLGTGVSAPATIKIRIVDPEPELEAPQLVSFGDLFVGETVSRELFVRNRGGGILQAKVLTPRGLSVEGASSFELAEGEMTILDLDFTPREPGHYTENMVIEHDGHRFPIAVVANIFPPVNLSPSALRLERGGRLRSGVLVVTNSTPKRRTFTFTAEGLTGIPESLEIDGEGEVALTVQIPAEFPGSFVGEIALSTGAFTAKVPVRADALPADLLIHPYPSLSLGKTLPAQALPFRVVLENRGGESGLLTANPPFGVRLSSLAEPIFLEPGRSIEVHGTFSPNKMGQVEEVLTFRLGESVRSVKLQTYVNSQTQDGATHERSARSTLTAPITPEVQEENRPPTEEIVDWETLAKSNPLLISPHLARPARPSLHSRRGRSITLRWPHFPDADAYRMERLRVGVDKNNGLETEWIPWEVPLGRSNGWNLATLHNMNQGELFVLRVIALKEGEPLGAPSEEVSIQLAIERPNLWFLLLAMIPIAVVLLWYLKRRSTKVPAE